MYLPLVLGLLIFSFVLFHKRYKKGVIFKRTQCIILVGNNRGKCINWSSNSILLQVIPYFIL